MGLSRTGWQRLVTAALCTGYAGYYFCRANLTVVSNLLIEDGIITDGGLGRTAALGTVSYTVGKALWGPAADRWGGRITFTLGAIISVGGTLAWSVAPSAQLLQTGWCINRFGQAAGWASAVNILGSWVPAAQRGKYFGVLTLAFLLGDAVARGTLSLALYQGVAWRGVVLLAAGVCSVSTTAVMVLLRPSRTAHLLLASSDIDRDGSSPAAQTGRDHHDGSSWRQLCSCRLLAAVGASIGIHTIREIFRIWTPRLLTTLCGLSAPDAALASIAYPLAGALAAITAGTLADVLGPDRRAALLGGFILALMVSLAMLYMVSIGDAPPSATVALSLVTAVGFAVVGPFSLMAGLLPFELGGAKKAASVVSLLVSGQRTKPPPQDSKTDDCLAVT